MARRVLSHFVADPLFQSLGAGNDLWKQAFGSDFVRHIGADGLHSLNRYFQQRHLLAHKDGIVDADYIQRCADSSYKAGQSVMLKETAVRECLALRGCLKLV